MTLRSNPGLAALAAEMETHGATRDAPTRSVMALLGDRWSTLIMLVLAETTLRHSELKATLEKLSSEQAISQKILTEKLRRLERDGFVARIAGNGPTPMVNYELTDLGRGFHKQIRRLIGWINDNAETILSSRMEADA